jgi:hypothetical protein
VLSYILLFVRPGNRNLLLSFCFSCHLFVADWVQRLVNVNGFFAAILPERRRAKIKEMFPLNGFKFVVIHVRIPRSLSLGYLNSYRTGCTVRYLKGSEFVFRQIMIRSKKV